MTARRCPTGCQTLISPYQTVCPQCSPGVPAELRQACCRATRTGTDGTPDRTPTYRAAYWALAATPTPTHGDDGNQP